MAARELTAAVEDVLVQGLVFLSNLDDDTYSRHVAEPFGASIGQHYRHVLEHFVALAEGIVKGAIDYDHRERNREWETSVETARSATTCLLRVFSSLGDDDVTRAIAVRYTVGYRGSAQQLESVLGREIAYCVSHAVHHFAIVRFIAAALGVTVAHELGIAPSTLKHRAAAAQAR